MGRICVPMTGPCDDRPRAEVVRQLPPSTAVGCDSSSLRNPQALREATSPGAPRRGGRPHRRDCGPQVVPIDAGLPLAAIDRSEARTPCTQHYTRDDHIIVGESSR